MLNKCAIKVFMFCFVFLKEIVPANSGICSCQASGRQHSEKSARKCGRQRAGLLPVLCCLMQLLTYNQLIPQLGGERLHGFPRHLQANEASIHPGEIWLCVAFHTQGKMSELSGGSWYHRVNSGVCGWIHGDEADEKFLRKCTTCWWRWICWRAPYKAEG